MGHTLSGFYDVKGIVATKLSRFIVIFVSKTLTETSYETRRYSALLMLNLQSLVHFFVTYTSSCVISVFDLALKAYIRYYMPYLYQGRRFDKKV